MKLKRNHHKNDQTTTFPWSIWSSIPLNKKIWIYRLAVFLAIFLTSNALCYASDQKVESLKQLIEIYDPTDCRECHEEIYDQWQNSHHARSITGIFMERYLKKGPFSVKNPGHATKKNFPCFKCHLPQLEKATDAVAAEIAGVILNDDKATMKKLNISCLVCHQDKAVVHGLPESNVMYGPKAKKEYPEKEHMRVKKSPFMTQAAMCGQCHGLGPIFEFDYPIQCATLYGSYLHAYIPSGGTQTCQECHMKNADHTCPPNFNDRKEVSERLRQALPLEVEVLSYRFQPFEKIFVSTIVVKTKITSKAGHRIPDG
jgi:mono/diheme cytochrome c family protein